MPVTGPAGILAFYILSASGYSGLFYKHKSLLSFASFDTVKYMAISLCSIVAYIMIKYLLQYVASKAKPVLPAEQIVMDVKRMNINFTLVGSDNSKQAENS